MARNDSHNITIHNNNYVGSNFGDMGGGFSAVGGFGLVGTALLIIALLWLIEHWPLLLIIGGTILIGHGLTKLHERRKERKTANGRYAAQLSARAERQNRDYLRDGYMEGDYPAETMPISNKEYVEYDDGLTGWV